MEDLDLKAALVEARATGELRLRNRPLLKLPDEIRELRGLRVLLLRRCGLQSLPPWIGELESLEVIDLSHNPVRLLPPEVGGLRLRTLGLSSTGIAALPEVLRDMPSLEVLALPGTGVRDLPSWIDELRELRALDLGANRLTALPPSFGELARLECLHLWGHDFAELPEVLRQLPRLAVLNVSKAGTQNLSSRGRDRFVDWYGPFKQLDQLIGSGGASDDRRLSTLPDWLTELSALRVLLAGGNQLERLPALPGGIEELWLGANRFEAVPDSVLARTSLQKLDLHANRLRELPEGLRELRDLRHLDLRENPLPVPPEVLADPDQPARILDFVSRAAGPTRRLDEAKLLVVGEGSVGKTSLIRRLVSDGFSPQEEKTQGIDVTRWDLDVDGEPIALNVWDFGGQEIMHATHQFFLTKRSLYVLVIDARQGEEQNRIEYWLKLIQSFGGSSPIVIVGNKTEQHALDIDERGLRAKYPDVIDVLSISCKTGAGIDRLQQRLAAAIERMPHVRDELPAAYFDVKQELEQLDEDYVAYRDYEALCTRHGVDDPVARESLVGFLHDLGTVLCFRDDPRLSDNTILNPEWVTRGVYRLLNSHLAAQRKGLLGWRDVHTILDTADYPPERRTFIVDMMKRFELCFESDGTLLVPDLLVKQEPDTGTWGAALAFEIGYDVLPSSVISRLIVRMHPAISKGTVWRTGLVVSIDGNRALIKGDREDAVVRILVDGPSAGRRGLLTAIRTELRAIGETIPGLTLVERVPVPGHPEVFVPYAHLLRLEQAGYETVVPESLVEEFPIRELLAGVEPSSERGLEDATRQPPTAREQGAVSTEAAAVVGRPWAPADALRLGLCLFTALVLLVGVFVIADLAVGPAAAAAITAAALLTTIAVGLMMLRSSGLLSEQGFLAALNEVLSRAGEERSP